MERKWLLLEKYLENELEDNEISEFTNMLNSDRELQEELDFQRSLMSGIKGIAVPAVESRSQIIMKKIMLQKKSRKSVWSYVLPPLLSYTFLSFMFAIYALRGYIVDSLWPQFGSFFVKAAFYTEKIIVVLKDLPLATIGLVIAGPALTMIAFSLVMPFIHRKIFNKEAINENVH